MESDCRADTWEADLAEPVEVAVARYTVNTYPFALRSTLRDCLAHLASLGFRSFEPMLIPGHYWPSLDGAGERRAIERLLANRDLQVLSLNQPNLDINLASPMPEMRKHSCAIMEDTLRLAADWGAVGIVLNPGKANPMQPHDFERLAGWFRESLDRLVPEAERLGIDLVVKNHPLSYLHRAADLVAYFDTYGWDQITIGYDVANACFGGEEPLGALDLLGDHVRFVYAADTGSTFRHDPVGSGTVRFGDIAAKLRTCQFKGRTVLEILADHPEQALTDSVARLQAHGWPCATLAQKEGKQRDE